MRIRYALLISSLFILSFNSCKKDEDEKEEVKKIYEPLTADLQMDRLVYFPDSSIWCFFSLENINGGLKPYSFQWINPDSLTDSGNFAVPVHSNMTIRVQVSDSYGGRVDKEFQVEIDTLDYEKHHIFNDLEGDYTGEFWQYEEVILQGGKREIQLKYHWSDQFNVVNVPQYNAMEIIGQLVYFDPNSVNSPDGLYFRHYSEPTLPRTDVWFRRDSIIIYRDLQVLPIPKFQHIRAAY